jgi:hypothetical protein
MFGLERVLIRRGYKRICMNNGSYYLKQVRTFIILMYKTQRGTTFNYVIIKHSNGEFYPVSEYDIRHKCRLYYPWVETESELIALERFIINGDADRSTIRRKGDIVYKRILGSLL